MHDRPIQQKQLDSSTPEHSSPESEGKSLTPPAFQLKASDGPAAPPVQRKQSSGGLPSDLVNGFAASTGHDLSDVNVHQNSDKPAQVGALAYAQGNDIHLGAGQDQHLAHEAAHIVQQREGRVQANTKVGGTPVNDSVSLESEADSMGAKAAQMKAASDQKTTEAFSKTTFSGPIQRYSVPVEGAAPTGAKTISDFIKMVEKEEAKYPIGEQQNTSLMITRLRKIFYGSSSWDKYLIPGAAGIANPYSTKERELKRRSVDVSGPNFDMVEKQTVPVDGAGGTPEIFNTQEIALETGADKGKFLDIGHVFAGLDAYNHRASVSASSLLTVTIDNMEGTTWVGDLGSVLAEAQIDYVNSGKVPTDAEKQKRIDEYAPVQDMLGNIDAYAIAYSYNVGSAAGTKVSDILRDFYLGSGPSAKVNNRYTLFSTGIGLTAWDGSKWGNEADRIDHYADQVNDAAAMYIGAGADYDAFSWAGARLAAIGMSMNGGGTGIVTKFFEALKPLRAREPK